MESIDKLIEFGREAAGSHLRGRIFDVAGGRNRKCTSNVTPLFLVTLISEIYSIIEGRTTSRDIKDMTRKPMAWQE